MKKIIGIGNALVDALVQVKDDEILEQLNLPKGSMQLIDEERYDDIWRHLGGLRVERRTGGSAGNVLLAAANLKMEAAFIGKTGRDENGKFYARERGAQGVKSIELFSTLPTGVAMTFITPDGQRTFGTYLGAAATMTAADLRQEWFEGYDYFFIEGYLVQNHELIDTAGEMAHAAGAKVCLDLASYNVVEADHAFFEQLLGRTDIVFANEEEARAMTGLPPREALDRLAEVCEVAVVKVGANGAWAKSGNEVAKVDAVPVEKVLDTTAAGDYFAGGFLYAHANGESLQRCLQAGGLLAAEVIQVIGTKIRASRWDAVKAQL